MTSADSASTLHAWDAIVEITGTDGVRRIPIHDFYIKAGVVDLRPGELQTAIIIPKEAYEGYKGHYIKYAMRNAMDIATTGCSVNVKLSADKKTMEDVRIAYGVAGPVPMRAPSAEAKGKGKPTTKAAIREFAQAVLEDINPRDSWRAAKDFRQHIAVVLAERALTSRSGLQEVRSMSSAQYKLLRCTINGKKVEKMIDVRASLTVFAPG